MSDKTCRRGKNAKYGSKRIVRARHATSFCFAPAPIAKDGRLMPSKAPFACEQKIGKSGRLMPSTVMFDPFPNPPPPP